MCDSACRASKLWRIGNERSKQCNIKRNVEKELSEYLKYNCSRARALVQTRDDEHKSTKK